MTQLTMAERSDEGVVDPVHLLLIASTKIGKSSYAAQAAIDGFRVLYVDSDNGVSALRWALQDHPDAMSRVHLISTKSPAKFWVELFRAIGHRKFRWNLNLDMQYSERLLNQTEDDLVLELNHENFPADLVVVLDGWTSFSSDAMGLGASAKGTDIIGMAESGFMQGVYGDANNRANLVCEGMQKLGCHCIVQAHDTLFERYEKPSGKSTREMKQHEMKLIETIKIPLSTSRPNGYSMGTRFNHIGWMTVDRAGRSLIDFTREPDRIGGGPPNRRALANELNFLALTGGRVSDPGVDESWFKVAKAGELAARAAEVRAANQQGAKPAARPAIQPAKVGQVLQGATQSPKITLKTKPT